MNKEEIKKEKIDSQTEEASEKNETTEDVKENTEEVINTEENKEPEIKVLKKEKKQNDKDKLKAELAEQKDKYLRLMAEYDNFRKRTAKEKADTFGDATIKAVTDILPIYDNFERALSSESSDENFKKGIEMIFRQFGEALKKLGVEEINPIGQKFNPDIAQAVNQIQDDNLGEDEVAQVFQKGYKLGDKIIRYAMVVVANP